MKKLIAALFSAALLLTASAQDTSTNNPASSVLSGPIWDAIHFAANGSNWIVCPFGIVANESSTKHDFGAGIALAYKLSPYVLTVARLDWLKSQLWMPSLNLQLQAPLVLFNKVTLTPMLYGGAATPVSGMGSGNGDLVGIFGAGAAVSLDFLGGIAKNMDLVGTYEVWTGGQFHQQAQYRVGLAYKF